MRLKSAIYRGLRVSNDINALERGKVARRVGRRAAGKVSGRIMRGLFR